MIVICFDIFPIYTSAGTSFTKRLHLYLLNRAAYWCVKVPNLGNETVVHVSAFYLVANYMFISIGNCWHISWCFMIILTFQDRLYQVYRSFPISVHACLQQWIVCVFFLRIDILLMNY